MSQVSSAKASVPRPRQKMESLLSVDEVAEFLGIPVATLYQWRHKGVGPDAYRVGRHLRYEPAAVRACWTSIWRITMAHIERRERRGKDGQVMRSYRVRWRGPDGKERNKSFKRKVDADRFAATVSADLVRGQYVDPDAGKILLESYARSGSQPKPSRKEPTSPSSSGSVCTPFRFSAIGI